jgi:two-component system, NarL family, nitrate/nitrite response regulator NarL
MNKEMPSSYEQPIRLMLVDDHQTVLWGLRQLIDSQKPKMEVVGMASNAGDALHAVRTSDPDVILLDMDLGESDSLDLLPELISNSKAKVLILTGIRDLTKTDEAILRGARGVVRKEVPTDVLLLAIEKVYEGEIWLDRTMVGRIFQKQQLRDQKVSLDRAKHALLTPKEREIVALIVRNSGASNKEIAKLLFMSEHTLRNHLTSIYQKLEVSNRIKLYVYAVEHGLGLKSE